MQFSHPMFRHLRYLIILLLGMLTFPANGQETGIDIDPILVRVKARIVSAGDSMAVPYVHVVNNRNRTGTTSNALGYFSMEVLNVDTLSLTAMGFKPKVFKVPFNHSELNTLTIYLEPVVYLIREVKVTGDKLKVNLDGIPTGKPSDIPQELRGDAFNEKPPVLAALFNPLSYWQYYLSRKEKRKRAVREAISLEKNWEMHSQNYNRDIVMMLTGLDEQEADNFMVWFNAQNVLPYTSTEYEVRSSIRAYFEIYKKEKNL